MAENVSIEDLRTKLMKRREWHRRVLAEIDSGIEQLDRLVSLAYGAWEEPQGGRHVLADQQPVAARRADAPLPGEEDAERKLYALRIEQVIQEQAETFDMRDIRESVNRRFGLNISEKQASNSLRHLLYHKKLKLVRSGGPRRPAIYARHDYEAPEEATAESSLFRGGSIFKGGT
jgi:hypothetical protein